jgi:hypothetical protein
VPMVVTVAVVVMPVTVEAVVVMVLVMLAHGAASALVDGMLSDSPYATAFRASAPSSRARAAG